MMTPESRTRDSVSEPTGRGVGGAQSPQQASVQAVEPGSACFESPMSPLVRERVMSVAATEENERLLSESRAREVFESLDKDCDGLLRLREVQAALKQLNLPHNHEAVSFLMDKFGSPREGSPPSSRRRSLSSREIDCHSFCEMYMEAYQHGQKTAISRRRSTFHERRSSIHEKPADTLARIREQGAGVKRGRDRPGQQIIGDDEALLFFPETNRILCWEFLITVVLLITLITMPLSLGFEEVNETLFIFNFSIDMAFLLDVAKNCNTGYIDSEDFVVMDRRKVIKHYACGWLCPDLASSIPVDAIMKWSGADKGAAASLAGGTKLIKLLRLVRLAKIFRLMKMSSVFQKVRLVLTAVEDKLKIKISDGSLKLYKLALGWFLFAHWLGCINFMLVRLAGFPEGSWAFAYDLEDSSLSVKYSWSLWKAFAMLILLEPTYITWCDEPRGWCHTEAWITLFGFYMGAIFYSLLISQISSILLSMNIANRAYEEKVQQVNEYMRAKRLPPDLRDNVREFYQEKFKGKMFDEDAMLKELTPTLRHKILHHEMKDVLRQIPVVSSSPPSIQIRLATALSLDFKFESEVVMEEGTAGTDMYFIGSGILGITVSDAAAMFESLEGKYETPTSSAAKLAPTEAGQRTSSPVLKLVFEGCYVGDVACLLGDRSRLEPKTKALFDEGGITSVPKRTATVTVVSQTSVLYAISREDLMGILQDYIQVKQYMENIALGRYVRVQSLQAGIASPGQNSPLTPSRSEFFHDDPEDVKTLEYQRVHGLDAAGSPELQSPKSALSILRRAKRPTATRKSVGRTFSFEMTEKPSRTPREDSDIASVGSPGAQPSMPHVGSRFLTTPTNLRLEEVTEFSPTGETPERREQHRPCYAKLSTDPGAEDGPHSIKSYNPADTQTEAREPELPSTAVSVRKST